MLQSPRENRFLQTNIHFLVQMDFPSFTRRVKIESDNCWNNIIETLNLIDLASFFFGLVGQHYLKPKLNYNLMSLPQFAMSRTK